MAIEDETKHKAQEADRLRSDPIFQEAVLNARRYAVEAMIQGDASDTAEMLRLQAKVVAIDALTTEIANMILRGKPREGADRA